MQAEIMSLRSGQWLQVIREQAQSGQTAEQWCRVHHTARSTYYRWKKALREALLAQMEPNRKAEPWQLQLPALKMSRNLPHWLFSKQPGIKRTRPIQATQTKLPSYKSE